MSRDRKPIHIANCVANWTTFISCAGVNAKKRKKKKFHSSAGEDTKNEKVSGHSPLRPNLPRRLVAHRDEMMKRLITLKVKIKLL